ncbi:MAG TPA: flagellar basal body rod protein FlgC [Actinomycetota bacterium]|jgi:flagellar basal-body rod protein FlgC
MSGPFRSLDVSGTGLAASQRWLESIANNIANANTVRPATEEPFRASRPVFKQIAGADGAVGNGVEMSSIESNTDEVQRVFDPANPLAGADGYVTRPAVDLTAEMSDMMIAGRVYQANLRAVESARDRYQAALRLGGRQ